MLNSLEKRMLIYDVLDLFDGGGGGGGSPAPPSLNPLLSVWRKRRGSGSLTV